MALDHTRDFFGVPGINPTDPAQTTIPLFFTRWITHFCAPVFFLLTGTGAYLSLRRKSKRELSRFLFTRGLWLIFLEIVVVRCCGWQFNCNYHTAALDVRVTAPRSVPCDFRRRDGDTLCRSSISSGLGSCRYFIPCAAGLPA
jgi:hypothetical protein